MVIRIGVTRSGARKSVFAVSVFLSAFLLFLLQPMLARMLLPVFGGSSAVWNTCMVFFQVVLLGGYAYAHGSMRRPGSARPPFVHGVLLLVSLLFLPRALPTVAPAAGSARPVLSILVSLALLAGVPFFVLSANSSLSQRWFSLSEGETRADPFWLYAASNMGSLIALLGYPLIVEPIVGLQTQLRYWSMGYAGFVALSFVCMLLARRGIRTAAAAGPSVASLLGEVQEAMEAGRGGVTSRRRVDWVVRSAVASSLLLAITMEITTDVVSTPLFWVLPLALYLTTFIIAFSPPLRPRRQLVAYVTMIGIALCLVLVIIPTTFPLWFALLALLGTLFAGALLCHGDIADDRPRAADLTEFYLWIAVGGVVGGVLNSLVAPMLFSALTEYPLTLVCLALLLPAHAPSMSSRERLRRLLTYPPAIALGVAIVGAGIGVLMGRAHPTMASDTSLLRWQFMPVAVLVCGVLLRSQPGMFALSTALTAGFMMMGLHFLDPIIDQGRSFFGISRVTENAEQRIMIHGVTVHGVQRRNAALRDIPTSYYYPNGPLGWVVTHAPANGVIGVVGLGAGSLAPLAHPGQQLTYYEIDPLVESMARRDFTFLADSPANVRVAIGDGRQLLQRVDNATFDLLVVDAFSSDAIPTHLMTAEALALYLSKLKPSGLLVMHISNRYADLARVFRGWRQMTGQRVAIDEYVPSVAEQAQGVRSTVAVAIGRVPAAHAPLAATKQWFWLDDDGPAVRWTDDHVNLLGVLDRKMLEP